MKTVTIPQKMSGTGTIRDLASDQFEREIKFRSGAQYAIVLAAYYGGKGYCTAQTAEAAVKLHERHSEHSHAIMDSDGEIITVEQLYRLAGKW